MAISGTVYTPKDVKLGLAEESTFGTAIADAAAFIEYPEFDSVTIDWGLTQVAPLTNRSRRLADEADTFSSQTGGVRTITISGLVLRQKDLPELLYAVTQKVAEAADPFQKTFSIDWEVQPDFFADAGFFCTIGLDTFIDAYHLKFTSCIGKIITLKYDGVGDDGRWKADIVFISGFAADTTATFSGTWTESTQVYLDGNIVAAKTVATNDVVLYSAEVTIENNAKRVGNNASGDCETYSIGVGGEGMELTGNVVVKYDANTQGLVADHLAGTARGITYTKGSTGVDGYFDLSLDTCLITSVPDENLDQGAAINVGIKGLYQSGNEITIAVCDDVDKSWPA